MATQNNSEAGATRLNALSPHEARAAFLKCCGSKEWARRMVADRPFAGSSEMFESAERIWWELQPDDWLEAFHSHPKIGEKKAQAQTSEVAQKWSSDEQAGVRNSAGETAASLAQLNQDYENKFGFIFIICATGKTADEMLSSLRERLKNNSEEELKIAANEQAKITQLRLQKLIDSL